MNQSTCDFVVDKLIDITRFPVYVKADALINAFHNNYEVGIIVH